MEWQWSGSVDKVNNTHDFPPPRVEEPIRSSAYPEWTQNNGVDNDPYVNV
jgi:hypothetical protein